MIPRLPVLLLLLIPGGIISAQETTAPQVPEQDSPHPRTLPPGQPSDTGSDKPAAPAGPEAVAVPETSPAEAENCPYCDAKEQLIIDLNYYRQIFAILDEIDQKRRTIDPDTLQAIHAALQNSNSRLSGLLQSPQRRLAADKDLSKERIIALLREINPELIPAAAARPAKNRRKKTPPAPPKKSKTPKKTGIDGLTVAHVNEANPAAGIGASVVLVSAERPYSLSVGGSVRHNGKQYKVMKVDYIEDPRRGGYHRVHLQEQAGGKQYIVPWE